MSTDTEKEILVKYIRTTSFCVKEIIFQTDGDENVDGHYKQALKQARNYAKTGNNSFILEISYKIAVK